MNGFKDSREGGGTGTALLPLGTSQTLWQLYRRFIRQNQLVLQLVDDALSNFLLVTPQSVGTRIIDDNHDDDYDDDDNRGMDEATSTRVNPHHHHRWREILYGLLSLHRLANDMALQNEPCPNSYGMTVELSSSPMIPATSCRILLTVIHSLLPTLLQVFSSSSSPKRRRGTLVWLERLKFLLRLTLLGSCWYQQQLLLHHHKEEENVMDGMGILREGGYYRVDESPALTVTQQRALRQRQTYVGRRTGRRVVVDKTSTTAETTMTTTSSSITENEKTSHPAAIMVGELLYIARPWIWAEMEKRNQSSSSLVVGTRSSFSFSCWLMTLSMDIVSLWLLQQTTNPLNPQSRQELRRRKMRLLLYLLRSPVSDKWTLPIAQQGGASLQRWLPLVGRLLNAYLQDWMHYLKHPYVTEEG